MSGEASSRRESGWDRVVPDTQPTLFPMPFAQALLDLGISRDEVESWRGRGWLSRGVAESHSLDLPEWNELSLVRDMDRSGLRLPTVSRLLSLLPRPLAVSPERLAFSFSAGWVMRPVPRSPTVEDLDHDLVAEWIESVPEEEVGSLWSHLDSITTRLRKSTRPS